MTSERAIRIQLNPPPTPPRAAFKTPHLVATFRTRCFSTHDHEVGAGPALGGCAEGAGGCSVEGGGEHHRVLGACVRLCAFVCVCAFVFM